MVERVGSIENMKDDEELEMLLGEIPHATSPSLHHHPSFANGHHHNHHHHHVVNGNLYVNASNNVQSPSNRMMMYGMYTDNDVSSSYNQNILMSHATTTFPTMFSNGHSSSNTSSTSHDPNPRPYTYPTNPYSELPESSFRNTVDDKLIDELGKMYINRNFNENSLCRNRNSSTTFGDFDYLAANGEINPAILGSQLNLDQNVLNYCYQWGIPTHIGMSFMNESGIGVPMRNVPYMTRSKALTSPTRDPHWFKMASGGSSNTRFIDKGLGPGVEDLSANNDSLIIQGEDLSRVRKRFAKPCENGQTKFCSSNLTEAQRYIFSMAKDQHGCRLLQKIFDDGNPKHVQIVFDEIIGHVIELMINPFGNYLMQKLLDVCNEEQRMQILMKITHEPRELVQISLNTHGTRVIQKLVETIKTRQEVKIVISALEPGFIALIKDPNGNHVIQRCLQCLNNEDNKFIFVAAAKFCVEIATHQHGCCVLQRCINHSTGELREKLVSEISKNGLLLAQDAFGNYVVQYILELQIPSAVSKLTSQFEGNYVNLATQKFSSHVVEKCLALSDGQIRSTIIRELILATHFEQLLQDPHANYVVQTALRVSEGPIHNLLVNVIESHKAISRNSPYSKRIFSHKLLKR
ncbi:putative pumilio homolog 8, chloroplastic [Rutidosis leptorrhynchoides]|uniref:putative pumilio homolog 8, chloroplastic n=1 Tax=Rutidosis leptorrhynchoides TaxID=125765 RepID=UPI003A9999EA